MSTFKLITPKKRAREPSDCSDTTNKSSREDNLPDVALAAITSSRRQKDVNEFINFLLGALERNSAWLNTILGRQSHFRCAIMLGAGPNRFQLQEIIYPSDREHIKLEVQLKESEDYDKIAIAALFKLANADIQKVTQYIKTRLYDNRVLKGDMLKGKTMGIQYALLRPLSDKQYRIAERIVVGTSMRCLPLPPAHLRNDHFTSPPVKKFKRNSGLSQRPELQARNA